MELLKVLDKNGQETGEIIDREIVHQKGLWHKEVAIWIFNSQGQILLQRRSKNKKQWPNKLALCAGHIEASKKSLETAKIELFEELGLIVQDNDLVFLNTEKKERIFGQNSINRVFSDVYFLLVDKDISEFKIQEEELSEVLWIDYLEFRERLFNHDNEMVFELDVLKKVGTLEILDNLYSKITH